MPQSDSNKIDSYKSDSYQINSYQSDSYQKLQLPKITVTKVTVNKVTVTRVTVTKGTVTKNDSYQIDCSKSDSYSSKNIWTIKKPGPEPKLSIRLISVYRICVYMIFIRNKSKDNLSKSQLLLTISKTYCKIL